MIPEFCVAITQAAVEGRAAHARDLQRQLTPLAIIAGRYGTIRVAHTIADLMGLDAGTLPKPLLPLPRDARGLVRAALQRLSLP